MSRRYIVRLELGVAAVVALIGLFFVFQAAQIRPALNDPIGPKVLPMFLAIALIVGAILIAMSAIRSKRSDEADTADLQQGYGFQQSNIGLIFAVIGSGIVYVAAFWAFGYFVATFIAVVLIMFTFGNRNWLLILGIALAVSIVYQFVFMGLMGLFDPAGKVFDMRPFTNWIIGA